MKYCENCGYQTENDQITYCPCCDTPLVAGNQFKIINQYNVRPKNEPVKSVLLKIAFPLIWMIIILMIMLVIVVNKEMIREAVQATPTPKHVNSSSTTQSPLVKAVSHTEEVSDNLEDENAKTQTDLITLPGGTLDLCQYFGQNKLKDYADFFSSSSSFCCGVI